MNVPVSGDTEIFSPSMKLGKTPEGYEYEYENMGVRL